MRNLFRTVLFFATTVYNFAYAVDGIVLPKFSDYPAKIYQGELKLPTYYKKIDGDWRDDMGKMVSAPVINFAGRYHIGTHSCGADCRYYTFSDLENGSESDVLDMFSNQAGRPLKTADGRVYITDLISRADSAMLVAQYHIEQGGALKEECRERIFSLTDGGKEIKSITKTINRCEKFQ
ncbi:hypothetical protein [Paraburkholderia terrae]|uniref:Uncharacterized protein n=1 Tax=Paraburkholderia terrae TaxID=311230 RepID=A0A2I8EXR6_9BURK|nr:hypothetical protein [Paraburkholderia terrae]AUT64248.1 hypothetical protein C2L65_31540 [Paraburkholderia terrae]